MAVVVPIISQFDSRGINKAITDFKKLDGAGNKATFAFRTLDKGVTTALKNIAKIGGIAAIAAGVIGKQLVNAGSDLEESMSKVNVVFGQSSEAVIKFADDAAKNLGISKQAALEATGTYGNLFQAFGIGQAPAQEMSTTLVQLAADLASFNNASIDDVLLALRSGLSGETEPLKRFGIALNDVRLKEEAMSQGLIKNATGTLPIAAKAQAAYALIMKDSALAQGDFSRTSDGVANMTRILQASFADVRAELGTALLPVFKSLLGFLQDELLPRLSKFSDIVGEKGIGAGLKYLGGELLNVVQGGNKFVDILLALGTAFAILRGITIAATISQNLFNVALFNNPIGIVVAAVIALGIAVVAAYVRFEGFRKVVHTVINFVIGLFEQLVNSWIRAINLVIKGVNLFGGILRAVGIGVPELGEIGEVTFGRIGDAADEAGRKVVDSMALILAAEKKNLGFKAVRTTGTTTPPTPTGGTGGGKSPLQVAQEQLKKYTDSLKGVTSAERSSIDARRRVGEELKKLGEATNAVTKAQAHFNKVTQGYGKDSAEAAKQARAVGDAQRALVKANFGVEDSIRAVKDAEEKLRIMREGPSARDVESAEIGLQKRKFDVEEAIYDVAEAEKELAALRTSGDATPEEIRRAEIALEEAKYAVRDATLAVTDSEAELTRLRTQVPTTAEVEQAERDLTDAKLAAEEATLAQGDATEELNKQNYIYDQIVNGAKEGTDEYRDALEALTKAKEAEEEASRAYRDALDSEREAIEKLIEAEKELRRVRAETPAAIVRKAAKTLTRTEAEVGARLGTPPTSAPVILPDFGSMFPVPFANGGIVTRPTLGLVGEAGAEAVIPLNRANGLGGTSIAITVNAGMGANGTEIGDQIVDALKRYQRRNGALPLQVV